MEGLDHKAKSYFESQNARAYGRECVLGKGESVGWSGRYRFKGPYRVEEPVKVHSGGIGTTNARFISTQ